VAAGPERTAPFEALGARCMPCAVAGAQVSVPEALGVLGKAGLTRVFCEGGGALAASLLAAGCVDELVTFHAGLVIGAEGRPAVSVLGLERLGDADRFQLAETRAVAGDTLSVWRRAD
jgi:diaminohydroxyphosphoribosylaminopyrimidine deaminase/5-amino-6-(5-phosphoribosylamino)uracil reductase